METNIIDTNVIAVANGRFEGIATQCIQNCHLFLKSVREKLISLDDKLLILQEYFGYANLSGQPGLGDAFLKWLWTNYANPRFCELITITSTGDDDRLFEEIPDIEDLKGFDRSDQKFLAVALKSQLTATIHNATDSDWEQFSAPIEELGVFINQLCPDFQNKNEDI